MLIHNTGMSANTTIKIYIDNETLPSIEFQLFLGHGIGFVNSSERVPWNTKRISLDANDGIYNNYQIPFSKSFRVSATSHDNGDGTFFWYIIRGVYNYPVIVGELELPSNSRLRLYKNERVTLRPFEFLDLVKVQDTSGALFQVTLAAESTNFEYLEGCVRAYIDGGNVTFLSSGTEDFFLSAFYFNEGVFHSDNSGLTYFLPPGTLSAYKFFETDPLLFKRSLHLKWRCCEIIGTAPDDCPDVDKSSSLRHSRVGSPDTTTVTTYTWVYEW